MEETAAGVDGYYFFGISFVSSPSANYVRGWDPWEAPSQSVCFAASEFSALLATTYDCLTLKMINLYSKVIYHQNRTILQVPKSR
jgi:hypothetical protein